MRPTYQYSSRPSETLEYPALREALDERYASLPPEDIEQLVYEMFGPAVQAEDLENIFSSIGKAFGNLGPTLSNFAQQAAPVIARVAPAAAQGFASGAMVGGPYAGLAGAGLGILSSLLGGSQAPGGQPSRPATAPAAPPQMPGAQMPAAPQMPGAPALPPGQVAASPAAAALASLVSRPELGDVLKSLIMGSHGRRTVPVGPGGTQVGLDAFTNLLGALATQASVEHALLTPEQDEAVPAYLEGRDLDPAVPEHRAAALYDLFREADRDEALAERRLARAGAARGLEAYGANGFEASGGNGAEGARTATGARFAEAPSDDAYAEVEYAMAMGRLLGEQDVTTSEAWDDSDEQ
jgi:hypothetical protein